jgi:hypothetical protein
MAEFAIGYARCSSDKQDLTVQHEALLKLGVAADRIYTDHGLIGNNPRGYRCCPRQGRNSANPRHTLRHMF